MEQPNGNSRNGNRRSDFFINDNQINKILTNASSKTSDEINAVLDKAESGLDAEEVAVLLQTNDPLHVERIFEIAGKIKEKIYGERVVMFAPLYVSDYCINQCSYCGFNCGNEFERRRLNMDEIRRELDILIRMGHKRLALEAGEDPVNCPMEYILECLQTIYDYGDKKIANIRRVNVNIAADTVENYQKLKEAGIGTYILFQETYHKETYEKVHLSGPKSDYHYHTEAFDRAMEGGIDDVGGGVLFGLYDYRYEMIALMLHNAHLEECFGVGFHTVSMPRIRAAKGMDLSSIQAVSDDEFLKIAAIMRIAVPFTGLIISTRESAEMRKKLINIGITQLSGGSTVEVGGYAKRESNNAQFKVKDDRSVENIIKWLMDEGYIPSFCTACYRSERVGDRFMSLAKSGNIKNVCLPNALLTLKEYALDYGGDEFREAAKQLIDKKLSGIEDSKAREYVANALLKLEEGERDKFL